MSQVSITTQMFDNLQYDTEWRPKKEAETMTAPTVMFVLDDADRDAAIYHLTESLKNPLAGNAIATVLVQESVRQHFIDNLLHKLPAIAQELQQHAGYQQANATIDKLKYTTIGKLLACDVTHEQLGAKLGSPSGFVTLHTFRTPKEAAALCKKETVEFQNATIWSFNFALAYGLVNELKCANYFINCQQKSLEPLAAAIEKKDSHVVMENSYCYTTLPQNGVQKSIVFPFGTTFAN